MSLKKLRKPTKVLFLLEAQSRDLLREIAFDRGISMGAALRESVEFWLKHHKTRARKGGR